MEPKEAIKRLKKELAEVANAEIECGVFIVITDQQVRGGICGPQKKLAGALAYSMANNEDFNDLVAHAVMLFLEKVNVE